MSMCFFSCQTQKMNFRYLIVFFRPKVRKPGNLTSWISCIWIADIIVLGYRRLLNTSVLAFRVLLSLFDRVGSLCCCSWSVQVISVSVNYVQVQGFQIQERSSNYRKERGKKLMSRLSWLPVFQSIWKSALKLTKM